jgi:hypothetical protein
MLQGINSGFGPPRESTGPVDTQPGPPGKVQDLRGYILDPGTVPDLSVWGLDHSQQGPGILGEGIPKP